jgi:hypothetical protein
MSGPVEDEPRQRWEEMATVTGSRIVETNDYDNPIEAKATITGADLAQAADYLDSPEAAHYRELLAAHAGPLPLPTSPKDEGPVPIPDTVPIHLDIDPYLAAVICQHELGRLGMANCHDIADIGHIVAGYLQRTLTSPSAEVADDVAGWVDRIYNFQIDLIGKIDATGWGETPPLPPIGMKKKDGAQ